MVKLVATLGTSPGGVLETYVNLRSGNYASVDSEYHPAVNVDEVWVIRTSDPQVEKAWRALKAVFICCSDLPSQLADMPLKMRDLETPEDYRVFRQEVRSKLSVGDYVDFTGGRKAMGVAAAVAALDAKAHLVTTTIPQQEYQRISDVLNSPELSGVLSKDLRSREECSQFRALICSLISKEARTVLVL